MDEGIYGPNLISQNPMNLGTEKQNLTEHSPGLTGSPCLLAVLYCWRRDGKFIALQIIPSAA